MLTDREESTRTIILTHVARVRALLELVALDLTRRGLEHDRSKLESPEFEVFSEFSSKLKNSVYLSDEYNSFRREMDDALVHHYKHNSHHPEHYANGIDGMNLFDIFEMFVDWKAAGEYHNTGDIRKSIELNIDRFKMSPQLVNIFNNTVEYMFGAKGIASAVSPR